MTQSRSISAAERIIEPMIALARCAQQNRIIIAGSKAIELMSALHRRSYRHVAATANCGRAAKQYDVALVDWRQRSLQGLATTLKWLVPYLDTAGVLVIWVDPQKPETNRDLRTTLERLGFRVEAGTSYEYGFAISARQSEIKPLPKAA